MTGLTVLVPGLARAVDSCEPASLSALRELVGRGQWSTGSGASFESEVFALFGAQVADESALPVAALDYYGATGRSAGSYCLRIDPVHLEPRGSQLYLIAGPSLCVEPAEADALTERISELYADEGWRVQAQRPDQWHLLLSEDPGIKATPLSVAAGHDIDSLLPSGERAAWWHARMNEIQMLLHQAPVNARRAQEDRYTLNSVWPWGYGSMPVLPRAPWGCVWTDESLTRGLALHTGCQIESVPVDAGVILAQSSAGTGLLVLGDGGSMLRHLDAQRARAELPHMERTWWLPMLEALKRRDLECLTLVDPGSGVVVVTRKDVRRWWRRIAPLSKTLGRPSRPTPEK